MTPSLSEIMQGFSKIVTRNERNEGVLKENDARIASRHLLIRDIEKLLTSLKLERNESKEIDLDHSVRVYSGETGALFLSPNWHWTFSTSEGQEVVGEDRNSLKSFLENSLDSFNSISDEIEVFENKKIKKKSPNVKYKKWVKESINNMDKDEWEAEALAYLIKTYPQEYKSSIQAGNTVEFNYFEAVQDGFGDSQERWIDLYWNETGDDGDSDFEVIEESIHKVRVGSLYKFDPVGWDIFDPKTNLKKGDMVRVVNLPNAPKANTMGHCYVGHPQTGKFIGMVHCNSLTPIKKNKSISESYDNPAKGAIIRRIMWLHPELVDKYGLDKIEAAVDDISSGLLDLDEIGSSDVSAWVNATKKILQTSSKM